MDLMLSFFFFLAICYFLFLVLCKYLELNGLTFSNTKNKQTTNNKRESSPLRQDPDGRWAWAGARWPTSPRDPLVSALTMLALRVQTWPCQGSMWALEIPIRFSGWCSKGFFPLSHLSSPVKFSSFSSPSSLPIWLTNVYGEAIREGCSVLLLTGLPDQTV